MPCTHATQRPKVACLSPLKTVSGCDFFTSLFFFAATGVARRHGASIKMIFVAFEVQISKVSFESQNIVELV